MAKIARLLTLAALLTPVARGEDWEKLADAESAANRPAEAAVYLKKAIALKPDDLALRKKHAELASWAGDSVGAERAYLEVLRLDPADYDSLYQLANTLSWQGLTRDAIRVVKDYLTHRPNDAKAHLFLGQLYQWSGDLDASQSAFERYKSLAGVDAAYLAATASRFYGTGHELAAAETLAEALKKYPGDCDLYTIQAETLSSLHRWGDMSDSLVHVSSSCPDRAGVAAVSRRLGAQLRHGVHAGFSYAKDNTGVEIASYAGDGRYRLDPDTYLSAGAEGGWLRGSEGSGLETQGGDQRVDQRAGWLGVERLLGPVWFGARVGHRSTTQRTSATLAKVTAEYRPLDGLWLKNEFGSDLYMVSPRAVSHGIRLIDDTVHAAWRFSRRGTVYVDVGYGSLSEGNFYWTGTVTPRWTVLGGGTFNLDAGVSGKVSSFNNPLNSNGRGYYAPNRYRQFMGNILTSWVFNADDAVYASMNLGAVKDENQPRYAFGYDYSIEGVFGLYRDWLLNPRVDFLDDLGLGGGASANYHRQQYTLNLTRRF